MGLGRGLVRAAGSLGARGDPELREAYEAMEPAFLVVVELIRARGEEGMTQEEVARRMGTRRSLISRVEQMETTPTLRTVHALATALGRQLQIRFL